MEAGIRALADNLGEGLVVIQQDRIVFLNDKLTEEVGIPRDELENRKLTEIFSKDFEYWRYFELRDRRETGEDIEYPSEIRFRIRSGRTIEMRNRSSVIDWGGKPATVHFLENITRRKEVDRLLTQQTEVSSILADTVSRILASPLSLDETAGTVLDSAMGLTESRSGVLVIDDENERIVMQSRCESGCDVCDLVTVMDSILGDPERLGKSRPGRYSGSFYLNDILDTSVSCKDGSTFSNILRVPAGNSGNLTGQIILAGATDPYGPWDLEAMEKVVEVLNLALVRHGAVEELRRAKETAEREAESRAQFMANVTHEVRSPLNGVLMMASLLQDTRLDADQKELLGVVTFSARTLDRLIRDLTDINQIQAGKFKIFNAVFDIGELCRNILETHRAEATRKGLVLEYSISVEREMFYGDRERIGQILANLMVNAIRYTTKGSVRLDVSFGSSELRFDITDTGRGISDKNQQDIFSMFKQVDFEEPEMRREGSGIGLAVVKELTDVMNGRMELESRPGYGSCFSILLPEQHQESITGAKADIPENSGDKTSLKILVADDEGLNRLYIRTILEREGFRVDEAFDGKEALTLVNENQYDLILMDINMPRMDGLEASASIRQSGVDVPIVAITAHAYGEDRFHISRAGFDDIVRKPFEGVELIECVNRYLRT